MRHTSYYCVKSSERIRASSKSSTNFRVEVYPKSEYIENVYLKSANIPFQFKNVTTTYGDQVFLRVFPDKNNILVYYDIKITLPHFYLTTSQLLQTINTRIQQEIVVQGIPLDFSITISPFNGYLQINTTLNTARFDFVPAFIDDPTKTYIFTMLGLNTNSITTFTNFDVILLDSIIFPFAYTESLPFQYLYLTLHPFPTCTFSPLLFNTHFVIPTSSFRPNVSLSSGEYTLGNPITFRENFDFVQAITVKGTLELPHHLNVYLSDEYMASLDEHAGTSDWSFVVEFGSSKLPNVH